MSNSSTRFIAATTFVAADVGNSRIKLGLFDSAAVPGKAALPEPTQSLSMAMDTGVADDFDEAIRRWVARHASRGHTPWFVASVNRHHTARLRECVANSEPGKFTLLTHRHVDLKIRVDVPEHVGMDRLMGAVAANALRSPKRPAIVVDIGTAITVDLVSRAGAFEGGAILPGIGMAARALSEQTDALPRSPLTHWQAPPAALGKSTLAAIESGILWGSIGAIRGIAVHLSQDHAQGQFPQLFVTGGASPAIVEHLDWPDATGEEHLVLGGIAIIAANILTDSQ